MVDIAYYSDYLSPPFLDYLLQNSVKQKVPGLSIFGGVLPEYSHLESDEALSFLCELYQDTREHLNEVLEQRKKDRHFIDQHTAACVSANNDNQLNFTSPNYQTVIGMKDERQRTVVGPLPPSSSPRRKVAEIPKYLRGPHVTLFGPPDSPKMAINAMNSAHRKLPNEPDIIEDLLKDSRLEPYWGADTEDSKTPLRVPFLKAAEHLNACFNRTLEVVERDGSVKKLAGSMLAHPIKRFPGLALPSCTHFFYGSPIPLHLYDFALHIFHQRHNKEALVFYVPKLENEEEAGYLKDLIQRAERKLGIPMGTVRIMVVMENPRAIFRINEIMDALYPYFVGGSLGWHDYLASTARLFKEDPNYRIPVKADPNIVIKHIKESHVLLADTVGARGGIKIGGMYGILPKSRDWQSDSFQVTIIGYIRDVVSQFKRGLNGFWVAHPDFVRIGIALVHAWTLDNTNASSTSGTSPLVQDLVYSLVLSQDDRDELMKFILGPDIDRLNPNDPNYQRALLAADLTQSSYIANNHPDEIRYNIFQALQYLADWLSGNGCVALPAQIKGVIVRVMDDLATTERSRWEVWHEIHHNRFSPSDFLKILHEELLFIYHNKKTPVKEVQVQWNEETEKWYPVAGKILLRLMTDEEPVEFATELLLPFTVDSVRLHPDPWGLLASIDPLKYFIPHPFSSFNFDVSSIKSKL